MDVLLLIGYLDGCITSFFNIISNFHRLAPARNKNIYSLLVPV